MTAKEYLKQIQNLHTKIENKRERLERIDCILTSPAVGEIKQDKVQTSISIDKQERLIVDKMALEDELQSLMYEEAVLIIKIGDQIDGMEKTEHSRLLHLRYEEGMKWRKIAEIMHYNYDYVKSDLHGNALEAFRIKYSEILNSM